MSKSRISWTERVWNPVRGCSPVSLGCANCYAARMATRFAGAGQPYQGLARDGKWTGAVRFVPDMLRAPMRWRKPALVFVNSMSDLFHRDVTDEQIAAVFGVMADCPQHTFQVLTKRPERLVKLGNKLKWSPNIWMGISAENQRTLDNRVPLLLDTPAAVRWVSAEPLLGPLDFSDWIRCGGARPSLDASGYEMSHGSPLKSLLDWIVVGGESGPSARPCDWRWLHSVVAQCAVTSTPCFVKQLGEQSNLATQDRVGRKPDEWPPLLRVRQWPRALGAEQ